MALSHLRSAAGKTGRRDAGLRALGFKGANFTIPHKVAVIQHLDSLSPAAELMGAVNCINRVDNKLVGDNTDGKGFFQSLREVCDPAGMNIDDPRRRRRCPGDRGGAGFGRRRLKSRSSIVQRNVGRLWLISCGSEPARKPISFH